MASIVGETFAKEALKLGITVVLPRFKGLDWQKNILNKCIKEDLDVSRLWLSIGLEDNFIELPLSIPFGGVLIDVANGGMATVLEKTQQLAICKSHAEFGRIMIGNFHNVECVKPYFNIPTTRPIVRVNIGGGQQCTTASKATGYGRGQITEIQEFANYKDKIIVAADGGVRDSACAAKAFGAGADTVILGTYFSKAEEAQNIIDGEYKCWGSASDYNQEKFGSKRRHAEGRVTEIDKGEIKPLKYLIDELWGGISSAVSYSGHTSLSHYIGQGIFELKK